MDGPLGQDPAATIALTTDEIDWLEGFFGRRNSSGLFELIDGYYCGLIAGPGSVQPGEYITKFWEIDAEGKPAVKQRYDSPIQAEYILSLFTRHWNTIAHRFDRGYPHVPTLQGAFDLPQGSFWALGFLFAIGLRQEAWQRPNKEDFIAAFILALTALAGRTHRFRWKLNFEERSEMMGRLPIMLLSVHDYWRGRRDPLARPGLPENHDLKIGRNAPCPCGSRKKYKRCCGSAERRHAT
jgi:uncharacterized protein